MELVVKVEYSEEVLVNIDEICTEEMKVYQYSPNQLLEIRRKLIEMINDSECSSETEDKLQNALRVVQDYLYIQRVIPLKMLESSYLKLLKNEDLVEVRNSLIRILNQHIIKYHQTLLPLHSRMIDVCASSLISIRDEMELRKMNPYLSGPEFINTMCEISNIGKCYPIAKY